jgi:membrane protease YdiL (CAAX protease family)
VPEPVRQPRDPVRPLLGAATCAFFYWFAVNLFVPVGQFLGGELVAITVPPLVAAALASALAMAIFESRGFGELGLHWAAGTRWNLLSGIALGAGAAALVILPPVVLGLARFEWSPDTGFSWRATLFLPVLLFCGAMFEEILFRGFALQYLIRGYRHALRGGGLWIAIAGVGTVFGLMHGGNNGATVLSTVNTTMFGVLFGAALLRSHDLWFPIGLHFGWNAVLPFLGVELSGLTIRVTGYKLVWKAGKLWSGGEYGPEASILCSAALVVLALAVWKVPVRRGWAYLLDGDGELPDNKPLESPAH